MTNDWRLTNQEKYLQNAVLIRREYEPPSAKWDHDHCAFCWARFSRYDGDLHEGYCTKDRDFWICDECFRDFREMFRFTVDNGGD